MTTGNRTDLVAVFGDGRVCEDIYCTRSWGVGRTVKGNLGNEAFFNTMFSTFSVSCPGEASSLDTAVFSDSVPIYSCRART